MEGGFVVVRLVVLLGRSPGVLRDVLCSLLGVGERVELVYVVGTMDSLFDEAERVLFECPCRGLEGVKVERVVLPYRDVDSLEKLFHFRSTIRRLIDSRTVVDVTGGRKLMSVGATLQAEREGARVSYLLIPPEELERINRECKPDKNPCKCTAEKAKLIIF